jgi:hypothetical protein
MKYNDNFILKPCAKKDLFRREKQFYESIKDKCDFTPKFFGTLDLHDKLATFPCIVLEDLTINMQNPTIIDIKMGKQTYEPTATIDKIKSEIKKYPYQAEIGFRITGFKVLNFVNNEIKYFVADKAFGRSILPNEIEFAIALLFLNSNNFRINVIKKLVLELEKLLQFMNKQTDYKFYCSSLLIIYDTTELNGDLKNIENVENVKNYKEISNELSPSASFHLNITCEDEDVAVKVSIIDFAHVIINNKNEISVENSLDFDYLFGLNNLLNILYYILYKLNSCDFHIINDLLLKTQRLQSKVSVI